MKQKREREEPCDICGHYHDYLNGEPCPICGHRLLPNGTAHLPSALPSEIIPDFLFLGSYDNASRPEILRTLGINNILNTVPSCPNLYKNSFNYHTASSSPPPFEECFAIIESIRTKRSNVSDTNTNSNNATSSTAEGGGKLLVHCMSGNSKSPSVIIYYLMRTTGMSLQATYDEVKRLRPSIKLTEEDAGRLREAEAQIADIGVTAAAGPFHWPEQQ